MRYLGSVSGNGTLTCEGCESAPVAYNFEGYAGKNGQVTGSGEIELEPDALSAMFGRKGVRLEAEDGHVFELRFSGTKITDPDFAPVDIASGFPDAWTKDR